MKVLLLDDAILIRDRLAAMISSLPGVEVSAAGTGWADVEARVLELHPDVVVVDVHAPRALGLDLIRWLRSAAGRPVVIALSSGSSFRYRAKCHDAGATYYFDKVREQDRMVEAIAELRQELA